MDSVVPEELQIWCLSVHFVAFDICGKASTTRSKLHRHLAKWKPSYSYKGNMSRGCKKAYENSSGFIDSLSWHSVPCLSQIRCHCTLQRCLFGFTFPSTTAFLAVNRGCKTWILSHSERTLGKRHCPHRPSCHNLQEVPGTTALWGQELLND